MARLRISRLLPLELCVVGIPNDDNDVCVCVCVHACVRVCVGSTRMQGTRLGLSSFACTRQHTRSEQTHQPNNQTTLNPPHARARRCARALSFFHTHTQRCTLDITRKSATSKSKTQNLHTCWAAPVFVCCPHPRGQQVRRHGRLEAKAVRRRWPRKSRW